MEGSQLVPSFAFEMLTVPLITFFFREMGWQWSFRRQAARSLFQSADSGAWHTWHLCCWFFMQKNLITEAVPSCVPLDLGSGLLFPLLVYQPATPTWPVWCLLLIIYDLGFATSTDFLWVHLIKVDSPVILSADLYKWVFCSSIPSQVQSPSVDWKCRLQDPLLLLYPAWWIGKLIPPDELLLLYPA